MVVGLMNECWGNWKCGLCRGWKCGCYLYMGWVGFREYLEILVFNGFDDGIWFEWNCSFRLDF